MQSVRLKKFLLIGAIFAAVIAIVYVPIRNYMVLQHKESQNIDTLQVMRDLEASSKFNKAHQKDSALYYKSRAFDDILKLGEPLSYSMNLKIAGYLEEEGDFAGALEYYMSALKILDDQCGEDRSVSCVPKYINLYSRISYALSLYNPSQSFVYLHKALSLAEEEYKRDKKFDIRNARLQIYNNLGTLYMDEGRTDSAEYYYKKAYRYRDENDSRSMGKLYNNLGIIAGEKGDLGLAERCFDKARDYYLKAGDTASVVYSLRNLSKCAYMSDDLEAAIRLMKSALEESIRSKDVRNRLVAEESLSSFYEDIGRNDLSFTHLKNAHALKDSLMGIEKLRSGIQAELQHSFEKQKNEVRIEHEKNLRQKQKAIMYLVITGLGLLLAAVTLGLLYRIQRNKSKQTLLEKEALRLRNENLQLRSATLEQELDSKEKTINSHAEYLLGRQDYVESLIQQINVISDGDSEAVAMLKDIQQNIKSSLRDEFSILFQNLHHDFYDRLYEKHNNLTPNEKRLCTFIRLNMSSKEISSITQQSVKSIEIARSRLRAKLGLERKDNLNAYLNQF